MTRIKSFIPNCAPIAPFRKEKGFRESYTVFAQTQRGIRPVIDLRLYCTGETWYACVWVYNQEGFHQAYGGARTTGSGYDKTSECASDALQAAGVVFEKWQDTAGTGMENVVRVIEELALLLGFEALHTFNAHG